MNKLNGKITKSATLRGAMTRGAGGGTYVEANPEGEATDTLEKLMVEDTIYSIRNVPDASSAHNGDVLTKIASGIAWLPPTKELPTYTSGDNGKVLKIVNGSPTWDYLDKYSTEEHVVGTWIDGRPLYEKTLYAATILNEGTTILDASINLNNTELMFLNSLHYSFNNYIEGVNMGFEFALINNGVGVYTNSAQQEYRNGITNFYATIRYVKKVGE